MFLFPQSRKRSRQVILPSSLPAVLSFVLVCLHWSRCVAVLPFYRLPGQVFSSALHLPGLTAHHVWNYQHVHAIVSIGSNMTDENGLSSLWDFLRTQNLQEFAVDLIRHGIRSRHDIVLQANTLVENGMSEGDISKILSCLQPVDNRPVAGRKDLPVQHPSGQRASLTLALLAAQPNNRKRSLDALDRDILARTSQPAQESRLRTFRAICGAWEVAPFPLSIESIRCCAASLKAGGYRSASLYMQAAVNYQVRHLREPVHPLIRATIRDSVRSIRRGLGPSRLKEGFDVFALAAAVDVDDQDDFDCQRHSHMADVFIICCWFMLREIEIAGASRHHLTLEADEVRLLIPVHKTSSSGSMTSRSLRCPCRLVVHRLCPWHATERHLVSLNSGSRRGVRPSHPLVPDRHGCVLTKVAFVSILREVLHHVGIQVHLEAEDGKKFPRFGGHSLRVSGAMMLASAQVPLHLIQLMGRWSSSAVERYTQQAPLVALPSLPAGVFQQEDVALPSSVSTTRTPLPGTPVPSTGISPSTPCPAPVQRRDPRVPEVQNRVASLEDEVRAIKTLIQKPEQSLVVRPRSRVVHKAIVEEQCNLPQVWQTKCGWSYGCSRFFRLQELDSGFQPCKKCFPDTEEGAGDFDEPGASSGSDSSSSESSSSEDAGDWTHFTFLHSRPLSG